MSNNTPGNPKRYIGENRTLIPFVTRNRRPTTADYRQPETGKNYIYGSIWQVGPDPTTGDYGELWMLQKIVSNQGYWVMVSGGEIPGGPVLTLSDTANTLVSPTVAGNIQIEGTSGIDVTADALNNKLTLSLSGGSDAVDSFTTNVGGPVLPTALGEVLVNASTTTYTDGATANTLKTEVQGTNHALFVGRGSNTPVANLAVGVDHSICMGNTGADPGFTTTGTPWVSGLSFDAGTNTLLKYENGTVFTPSITGSTSAGTATYSSQYGVYSRIGNMVFVQVNLVWSGHTGTGDMLVTGLPYIFSFAAAFYPMAAFVSEIVLPANAVDVFVDGNNNTTQMEVVVTRDNATVAPVAMDAAGGLSFLGMYLTSP